MTVTYNQIADLRIPYTRMEFDNKNALTGVLSKGYKALAVGQQLSTGLGSVGTKYLVSNADQAKSLFGAGSVLHGMAEKYFARKDITDVTFISLAEPSGVKATGKITISGPATASGTLVVYIADRKVSVSVADEDTADDIAAALVQAINAKSNIPAVAAIDDDNDDEVNLTARAKGIVGNDIDIRVNYNTADDLPAGVTIDIDVMTGGTLAPDYSGIDAILGEVDYDFVAIQDTDSDTRDAIKTLTDSRNAADRMLDMSVFAGNTESVSTVSTLGAANNSEFLTILSVKGSPTPSYEIAAALCKAVISEAMIDPSKGCQTVILTGVKAPALEDRLIASEQETLLHTGIATSSVNSDGTVAIQRLITTYQTNEDDGEDTSYLDVSTIVKLARIRYDFVNRTKSKFARYKIANDNQPVPIGQEIITPSIGRAHCIQLFKDWQQAGWVEDLEGFKAGLLVERNASNPNRMDFVLPVNVVNDLLNIAAKLSFIL